MLGATNRERTSASAVLQFQRFNFLGLELFPATFLQSFLETTDNTATVDLLLPCDLGQHLSESQFPCLENGEKNPHLFHTV